MEGTYWHSSQIFVTHTLILLNLFIYFSNTKVETRNSPDLIYFQDAFGDLALFFCDPYGGTVIAVLWKPKAFIPVPFKVRPEPFLHCLLKCLSPGRKAFGTLCQEVGLVSLLTLTRGKILAFRSRKRGNLNSGSFAAVIKCGPDLLAGMFTSVLLYSC